MVESAKVQEVSIGKNRDSDSLVRLIKAQLATPQDIQTLQLVAGVDHSPLPDTQLLVLEIGESWKIAIPLTDGVEPTAKAGEKYIYSQDSDGKIAGLLKLMADGSMEINGNDDFAAGFNDLKSGFDELKAQSDANFNALVVSITAMATLFNAPAAPILSAPGLVTPYVKVALTASIDGAKVPTVKLP